MAKSAGTRRPLLGGAAAVRKSSSISPLTGILVILLSMSVLLLVLIALGVFSLPVGSPDVPISARISRPLLRVHRSSDEPKNSTGIRAEPWTEVLSWEPRAFVYHNFLSKEECEHLITLATPHMKKSTVVDAATGGSTDSRVRTSTGMFFRRGQDKIISTIEKRIADFTFIPSEHGEGLQVLHYEEGQKYEPHFDYFHDEFNTKNGGQRIATLLMYLSDVEEGGETVFPSAKFNTTSLPYYDDLSDCARRGLAVKPKMGDALLFWSMKPDATLDPTSLHGGCPVIKGNKWSSTKWMRVHDYRT